MAKVMSATPDQKAKLEAAVKAIDWSKIDWSKVALIMQLLMGLFGTPVKGASLAGCSHEDCCAASFQAALESAQCAAHCLQSCHVDPISTE